MSDHSDTSSSSTLHDDFTFTFCETQATKALNSINDIGHDDEAKPNVLSINKTAVATRVYGVVRDTNKSSPLLTMEKLSTFERWDVVYEREEPLKLMFHATSTTRDDSFVNFGRYGSGPQHYICLIVVNDKSEAYNQHDLLDHYETVHVTMPRLDIFWCNLKTYNDPEQYDRFLSSFPERRDGFIVIIDTKKTTIADAITKHSEMTSEYRYFITPLLNVEPLYGNQRAIDFKLSNVTLVPQTSNVITVIPEMSDYALSSIFTMIEHNSLLTSEPHYTCTNKQDSTMVVVITAGIRASGDAAKAIVTHFDENVFGVIYDVSVMNEAKKAVLLDLYYQYRVYATRPRVVFFSHLHGNATSYIVGRTTIPRELIANIISDFHVRTNSFPLWIDESCNSSAPSKLDLTALIDIRNNLIAFIDLSMTIPTRPPKLGRISLTKENHLGSQFVFQGLKNTICPGMLMAREIFKECASLDAEHFVAVNTSNLHLQGSYLQYSRLEDANSLAPLYGTEESTDVTPSFDYAPLLCETKNTICFDRNDDFVPEDIDAVDAVFTMLNPQRAVIETVALPLSNKMTRTRLVVPDRCMTVTIKNLSKGTLRRALLVTVVVLDGRLMMPFARIYERFGKRSTIKYFLPTAGYRIVIEIAAIGSVMMSLDEEPAHIRVFDVVRVFKGGVRELFEETLPTIDTASLIPLNIRDATTDDSLGHGLFIVEDRGREGGKHYHLVDADSNTCYPCEGHTSVVIFDWIPKSLHILLIYDDDGRDCQVTLYSYGRPHSVNNDLMAIDVLAHPHMLRLPNCATINVSIYGRRLPFNARLVFRTAESTALEAPLLSTDTTWFTDVTQRNHFMINRLPNWSYDQNHNVHEVHHNYRIIACVYTRDEQPVLVHAVRYRIDSPLFVSHNLISGLTYDISFNKDTVGDIMFLVDGRIHSWVTNHREKVTKTKLLESLEEMHIFENYELNMYTMPNVLGLEGDGDIHELTVTLKPNSRYAIICSGQC